MTQLPDKLSDLLDLAVTDAQKCEADPRYSLNMGNWFVPNVNTCSVCMAGAVMANTLAMEPKYVRGPWDFNEDTAGKLRAIDRMRGGEFDVDDLHLWEQLDALISAELDIETGRAPWSTYREAAELLRKAGL